MAKKEVKKKKDAGDFFFVAALFIGLGVGLYFGRPDVGVLLGLATGFLIKGIFALKKKR